MIVTSYQISLAVWVEGRGQKITAQSVQHTQNKKDPFLRKADIVQLKWENK
ncbi:hypothetical protein X975_23069, partial [Stegodyphus mimosarum]